MANKGNVVLDNGSSKKEISESVQIKIRGAITKLINVDPSTERLEKALKKASKILSEALRKHFKEEQEGRGEQANKNKTVLDAQDKQVLKKTSKKVVVNAVPEKRESKATAKKAADAPGKKENAPKSKVKVPAAGTGNRNNPTT